MEIEEEIEIEKFPRRKLLAVPGSIPTGKLDAENLEKFDFTQKKLYFSNKHSLNKKDFSVTIEKNTLIIS